MLCTRANVDKKDKTGQTALHYAVSQGLQEIVEIIVNAGANINLISKGETPLCRAAPKSNAPLISYLLAHGADISVPSPGYNGALPIHISILGKNVGVLKVLIEGGASVDSVDGNGRTPLV
jgi:ankyrin repeat protein